MKPEKPEHKYRKLVKIFALAERNGSAVHDGPYIFVTDNRGQLHRIDNPKMK